MTRTFAIGDIHGCNRTLNKLLDRLQLKSGERLIFLGDYIDRGPDSKGVVDTIFGLQSAGIETVCLRGNHEQLLLTSRTDKKYLQRWLVNGGEEALASFGVKTPEDIPEPYLNFFSNTLFFTETGRYICVHGGIDVFAFDTDPLADPAALMWARYWYRDIDYGWLGDRIILHGHTPEPIGTIREQHRLLRQQQYLNLDNGCVYAKKAGSTRPGLGSLLAFCLETRELVEQENLE